MTRRTLLATLAPALVLPACGGGGGSDTPPPPAEPRFTFQGLAGRIVRRLRVSAHGELLAATDNGLWRRADSSAAWQSIGLAGHTVLDVVATGGPTLLASVYRTDAMPRDHRLVESRDSGTSWQTLAHDFGGDDGAEAMHALAFDGPRGRLLATGTAVLAESTDGGRRWRRLAGDWHGFAQPKDALAVEPSRGDVWYGGQDAIEGFVLLRYRQASRQLDSYPGLMPAPSVAKGIRFVAGQPQRVIVGGEGGLVQTIDDGAHWTRLLDAGYRFHFDVLPDPLRPRRLVTASWEKNFDTPQPLVVQVSDDDGATWRRIEHPDKALFGGVWSMAAAVENGRAVYDFGLYRGGVMRLELP